MSVSFVVYGIAQPAGSKRGFVKAGRVVITDASAKSRPWKAQVSDAAAQASDGPLLAGPLTLTVDFYLPRPKGHIGVKGVRPSAPAYPIVKPDTTKLLRAVEDALTGIVWRDDAQVVEQTVRKMYGEPARAEISVDRLAA